MDPTLTTVIAIASSVVSAIFGALMVSMRTQIADWKKLYTDERADHKATLEKSAQVQQETSKSVRELADFLHELPRRRQDYETSGRRP